MHPALTEAVAWIPGRCDLLFGLGLLIAAHGLVSFRNGSRRGLLLHIAGLTVALFSKEAGIVSPVAFALLWLAPEWRPALRAKALWSAWVAVLALYLVFRSTVPEITASEPLTHRLHTAGEHLPVLLMQLGKLVVPYPLAVLAHAPDTPWVPGALAAAGLLALARLVPHPALYAWGISLAVLFILPSLPVSDFLILENRLYVPAMGLAASTAAALRTLWPRRPALLAVALSLVAGSALTVAYARNFRDPATFTAQAVRTSPTLGLAHLNRGIVFHLDGDLAAAEREYTEARRLDPNLAVTHNNLGLISMNRGDLPAAESAFRRELALNPRYDTAHYNLGLVFARTGRLEEAAASWRKALELNPGNEDARADLARADQQGMGGGPMTSADLGSVSTDVVVRLYRDALAKQPENEAIRKAFRTFCEGRRLTCE